MCHAFIFLHQKISKHGIVVVWLLVQLRLFKIRLCVSLSCSRWLLPRSCFRSRVAIWYRLVSANVAYIIVTRQNTGLLVGCTVTWLIAPCLGLSGMHSTFNGVGACPGARCFTRLIRLRELHWGSGLAALSLLLLDSVGKLLCCKLPCYSGRALMPVLLQLRCSLHGVCSVRLRLGFLAWHGKFKWCASTELKGVGLNVEHLYQVILFCCRLAKNSCWERWWVGYSCG